MLQNYNNSSYVKIFIQCDIKFSPDIVINGGVTCPLVYGVRCRSGECVFAARIVSPLLVGFATGPKSLVTVL